MYDLLKFECRSNYQPPIMYQSPDAGGFMAILENQKIIQIVNVLGTTINLSGTFKLQDTGFMLIEEITFRNLRLSKVISEAYYTWNGPTLTIDMRGRSTPTGPYPGVPYIMKTTWHKR